MPVVSALKFWFIKMYYPHINSELLQLDACCYSINAEVLVYYVFHTHILVYCSVDAYACITYTGIGVPDELGESTLPIYWGPYIRIHHKNMPI